MSVTTAPTGRPVRLNRYPRLQRLSRWYSTVAILLLNTGLCYLCLNIGLGLLFAVRDVWRGPTNPVTQTYGQRLDQVYPDLPDPERTAMLTETWTRPYEYADYIHFRERPFRGRYVNVHEAGFRYSENQGPWPIDTANLNVFCFGGSTTFGYGVPDQDTVPSALQRALQDLTLRRVCVYNFGVGWHYSTQERLRFEQLLAMNVVPDVALFLDGINDSTQGCLDRPAFSPQMAQAFNRVQGFGVQSPSLTSQEGSGIAAALFWRWPIGRFARRFAPTPESSAPELIVITPDQAARSSQLYRWNRTLISAAARVREVSEIFVVQPSPGYKLDPQKHPLWDHNLKAKEEHFYVSLQRDLEQHPPGDRLLWCAELPETTPGPLYVDACHYTAGFSRALAKDIVRQIVDRNLIPNLGVSPSPSSPTAN